MKKNNLIWYYLYVFTKIYCVSEITEKTETKYNYMLRSPG